MYPVGSLLCSKEMLLDCTLSGLNPFHTPLLVEGTDSFFPLEFYKLLYALLTYPMCATYHITQIQGTPSPPHTLKFLGKYV